MNEQWIAEYQAARDAWRAFHYRTSADGKLNLWTTNQRSKDPRALHEVMIDIQQSQQEDAADNDQMLYRVRHVITGQIIMVA